MYIQTHFCLGLLFDMFTMKNTGAELKRECAQRGLKTSGKKEVLLGYLTGKLDGSKKKSKKKSHIMLRESTMAYECMRVHVDNVLDTQQPKFTSKDREMKEKIFGFKGKTSFLSGVYCSGVGDHIYGVREGLAAGYDWVGSNSLWNTVPVTHAENVSYKDVIIGGKKKNLAYDDFTSAEIDEFSGLQKKIYTAIKSWEIYAQSRGAHMKWDDQRKNDEKFKVKTTELLTALESFVLGRK